MLLLYDMQVNAGSMHGKSITKDLALRTIRWSLGPNGSHKSLAGVEKVLLQLFVVVDHSCQTPAVD